MKPLTWTAISLILVGLVVAVVAVITWPEPSSAVPTDVVRNVIGIYVAVGMLATGIFASLLSMHAWTITTGFNEAIARQNRR